MGRDFIDLKDGDRLEPYHINMIYAELRRWRKLRGSSRVAVNGAKDGEGVPTIDVLVDHDGYIAVANGTITAAVNSTVGTGAVTIQRREGNTIAGLAANGLTITDLKVYNAARDGNTANGSIANGKRVWVQKDAFGDYWVGPLECED